MALLSRLRTKLLPLRSFSTLLSSDSKTPLSAQAKTRAALSLLKSETNPEKILDICRAASLNPDAHIDRVALSAAISALSRSNNFSYIKTFIEELRSTRPDLKTERFHAHSIVLFGQAKMVDHAVGLFKDYHQGLGSGQPGSVRCLNSLIFACILAKDFKEMKRVYMEFPKLYNINPDVETYNRVIKGFSESRESSSSYSVLSEMDRIGLKPNAATFGEMLGGFYGEEKLEDVAKVLELMKEKYGIRLGVATYNIRIKSLCKLKKSKEAKVLFDGMMSKGPKPNSATFCDLIRGFGVEGDLEEAKRLFKMMVNRGFEPGSDVYFTLVHFLCQGGDFESALRVCRESMGKGWFPNVSTMKALVNGLKGIGKVDEAKEVIGQVKGKFQKKLDIWEEVEAGLGTAQ